MERNHCFYAYHGTLETYASNIIRTQRFEPGSQRYDHWLGQGTYFYREDMEQARIWAETKIKNCLYEEKPSVVEVIMRIIESNFLNLDTRNGMEYLASFIEKLEKKLEKEGLEIKPCNDSRSQEKIRCYIMSFLPDSIWVIQRTFEINSKYDSAGYFKSMGLRLMSPQVCVRNHCAIQSDSVKLVL